MTDPRRTARLAGIAAYAAAVLVSTAGCANTTPEVATPRAVPAGDQACWPRDQFANEQPSLNPPYATELTAQPVELTAGVGTANEQVRAPQAILDFPQTEITDPAQNAVVLVSTTVFTTDPAGWQLDRSLAVIAFHDVGTGSQERTGICPLDPARIAGILRATGREALPARIEPGQTASGWVAFVVPRTATVLTLRLQRLDPDGGYAAASYPLLERQSRAGG